MLKNGNYLKKKFIKILKYLIIKINSIEYYTVKSVQPFIDSIK